MIEPVRIAVVGLGRMGMVHVSALSDVPEIEVVGLVDVQGQALEAAAAVHPRAKLYTGLTAALEEDAVDAVLLATPTPTHPELTRASLGAGKHVLCEKPLALDAEESDRLAALAARLGLVLQIGFWRRFSPPWRLARKAIAAGDIGTPVLLRLSQWDADPPPAEFCDPTVSGGIAVDCGVHEFDLAEWLTGRRLIDVRAESLPGVDEAIQAAGDVDNLLVIGTLEGGAKVIMDLSRNARYADDVRSEVLGSAGAIFIETVPEARTSLGNAAGLATITGSETGAENAMISGLRAQAAGFAASVRGESVDHPNAIASSRAVRAGVAASESLRSGATLRIPAQPA